ncbi:MAG TPA: hypothetical protein VK395_26945 [Gemmataceae bacterium]|nr:hypothetical protein [Gemmataceae bacterium]
MDEREAATRRLAQRHYLIEPAISEIRTIGSGTAFGLNDTIALLEVNQNTIASGIMPLRFDAVPASGIPFPSVIVEVTPDEYEQIKRNELKLPYDWSLGPLVPRANEGNHD